MKAAVSKRDIMQQFEKLGLDAVGNSPADFSVQIQQEAAVWKETIRKAGIKAE